MPKKNLNQFKRFHKNPRKISEAQKKDLEEAMDKYGDLSGIVVNLESGEFVGGNQRSAIIRDGEIEYTEIYDKPDRVGTVAEGYIVWRETRWTYREVRWDQTTMDGANLAANKLGGDWDFDILSAWELETVTQYFKPEELPFIRDEQRDVKEDNFKVVVPEDPISRPGDLYELNNHRIQCGDSTHEKSMAVLMNRKKARVIFTDPPYGVSYDGAKIADAKQWDMIRNDELRNDGLFKFLQGAFACCETSAMKEASLYTCYASRNHIIFESALNDAGWVVKQQIIWSKGHVMGRSDYHWCHEPIMYCCKDGTNSRWYGDRTQRTTLNDSSLTELKKMTKENLMGILSAIKKESDIWQIKRDAGSSYEHPTQKPITLAAKGIINSSLPGEIILDPFMGAGFAILAAEQTDRVCYGQEIDPGYVDVIVKRWITWMNREGKKIRIIKNGAELKQSEIDQHLKNEKNRATKNKGNSNASN